MITFGVSYRKYHSPVQGHKWAETWGRCWKVDLTDKTGKPLICFSFESARFKGAFSGAMDDGSKIAELRKSKNRVSKVPIFRMWLAKAKETSAMFLPMRSASQFLEVTLPAFIQLYEKLRTHVGGYICHPGELSPKLFQLLDLIIRSVVVSFSLTSSQPQQPLFMSEVPQGP